MYHLIVDISIDNQTAQFHLTNDKPKCQLELLHEETGEETPTEALLFLDQNELMIERVGHSPIALERGSRNRTLQSSHPTRVLPHDIIRIGETVFHVDRILHQDCQPKRKISPLQHMTNKAIIAGAAAMMTAVIPACNPANPANNDGDTNTVVAVPNPDNQADANKPPDPATDGVTEEQRREIEMTNVQPNRQEGEALAQIPNANPAPSADSNVADSTCENGKRMCLTNNRYECENHQWKLIEKCPKPALCKYDDKSASTSCTNTEPCTDGEYACFGSSIRCEQKPGFNCGRDDEMYQCKDGHWQLAATCPENQTCRIQDDTAKCVAFPRAMGKPKFGNECKDSQMKCESGARMFCHWGRWKYKDVCDVGEMCTIISDTDVRCEPEQSAGVNSEK